MHAFTSHMRRMNQQTEVSVSEAADNPLLAQWGGSFGVPAFDRIKPEHFRPAFARAFAAHAAEVAAIAGNAQAPTFANTIDALEASGETLARAVDLFHLLAGAHTNDAILAFERELAPLKAKHWDRILMDETVFGRIDALYRMRDRLALSAEQRRVLERYPLKFTRAGAALDAPAKRRLADVNERLATLGTTFSQKVLADEQSYALVLDGEDDLAGLPDFVRAAARTAAQERGLAGQHGITISRSSVEPFLQFSTASYAANRAFGLTFERRVGVPVWHDDVRVWEVRDAAGRHRGLFFGDYFARTSKHSGAWMTALRDQERLRGDIHPLVVNVMNFSKAGEGEPTLLSFDGAKTLFHEFGHALHALLSDVTYPTIAGTNVLLDWSELPSQLFEHWLERPEILRRFALHNRTGEPLPEDQLRRLLAPGTFNQGQTTVEYLASALIDLDMHLKPAAGDGFDTNGFEQAELARIGMPAAIVMRHRPTHFQHVFAGAGYASAYYSYLWSEVLDADAFAAFEETGDIFDAGVAKRLHDDVYAAGGARDPADLYTAFRGRLPTPDGLLRRRGLSEDAA